MEGWTGYIITHEVYFATLDYVPMIIAITAFNIWHPGMYIASSDGLVEGRPKGEGELEAGGDGGNAIAFVSKQGAMTAEVSVMTDV